MKPAVLNRPLVTTIVVEQPSAGQRQHAPALQRIASGSDIIADLYIDESSGNRAQGQYPAGGGAWRRDRRGLRHLYFQPSAGAPWPGRVIAAGVLSVIDFPWEWNTDTLHIWQRGETGYPIVDADMRELWRTGYMHNRVRMIVASFLVKDLLVHWLEGARWFWDTLVVWPTIYGAGSGLPAVALMQRPIFVYSSRFARPNVSILTVFMYATGSGRESTQ